MRGVSLNLRFRKRISEKFNSEVLYDNHDTDQIDSEIKMVQYR